MLHRFGLDAKILIPSSRPFSMFLLYDFKKKREQDSAKPCGIRGRRPYIIPFFLSSKLLQNDTLLSCWYFSFFCWAVGSFTSIRIRGQVCLFLYIHYNQDAMAFTIIVNSFLPDNSDLFFFSLFLCLPSKKTAGVSLYFTFLVTKNKKIKKKIPKIDTRKTKQKSVVLQWFTSIVEGIFRN